MTLAARFRAPGWYRVLIALPLAFAFSIALVAAVRAAYGWDPIVQWNAVATVALITMPLAFLVAIGCFTYWFDWALGKPTVPDDHSSHGARSWRDYFKVNTDHKVIGIQYIVTTFFFFILGGLMAMLIRAELTQPG
ncbi:MAG: cytochrome c oxidase subunit I, partial [Solirubrobacterales bacterium]|nr:cytochrome c oxidase subunit I [Solirubrobacterales bacterium]